MEFRRVAPPPDLAPWLEAAWSLRGHFDPAGSLIVPDGRVEIVFHLAGRPIEAAAPQPHCLAAGFTPAPVALYPGGLLESLGVTLCPAATACLLPRAEIPASFAFAGHYPRWTNETLDRLAGAASGDARFAVLWGQFRRLLAGQLPPDAAVAASVQQITRYAGRGPIDAFRPAGLGTRQWQRRFHLATGFSPKMFARLTRFQSVLRAAHSRPPLSWARFALAAGYYDQAHLIRDFHAFTGLSPRRYFASQLGLADFYHDAFFQDKVPASS